MKTLVITLTRDGRPLAGVDVVFEGGIEARSDGSGVVSVVLPPGRVLGQVLLADGSEHEIVVVNAHGLRRVRVAVTGSLDTLEDEGAKATMPSDRYEPLAWLGSGAMGRVLKARDTRLDRLVAVKVLPAEVAPSPTDRERFISEGRALARVAHRNLLGVYDVGINGAVPYLVVEFIDGPDLLGLVEATGALPISAACAAGAQLCSALDALHQAGLVHRDVKPSNGLVDGRGRVVLADFGLVKPLDDVADPRSKVIGTPGFMSPEHMQGQPLGPATDIYALGATLFNIVAGEIPLDGPALLVNHLTAARPDVRDLRPDAPEALADLIISMMAIDPTERPTGAEARAALEDIGAGFDGDVLGPFMPRFAELANRSGGHLTSGGWLGAAGSGERVAGAAGRTTPGRPFGEMSREPSVPAPSADHGPAASGLAQRWSAPGTGETLSFKAARGAKATLAAVVVAVALAAIAFFRVANVERQLEETDVDANSRVVQPAEPESLSAPVVPEPRADETRPDDQTSAATPSSEVSSPALTGAPNPGEELEEGESDTEEESDGQPEVAARPDPRPERARATEPEERPSVRETELEDQEETTAADEEGDPAEASSPNEVAGVQDLEQDLRETDSADEANEIAAERLSPDGVDSGSEPADSADSDVATVAAPEPEEDPSEAVPLREATIAPSEGADAVAEPVASVAADPRSEEEEEEEEDGRQLAAEPSGASDEEPPTEEPAPEPEEEPVRPPMGF